MWRQNSCRPYDPGFRPWHSCRRRNAGEVRGMQPAGRGGRPTGMHAGDLTHPLMAARPVVDDIGADDAREGGHLSDARRHHPWRRGVPVFLVTMRGHFAATAASRPPGAAAPAGQLPVRRPVRQDLPGARLRPQPSPPPVSPASLGPVTYLTGHPNWRIRRIIKSRYKPSMHSTYPSRCSIRLAGWAATVCADPDRLICAPPCVVEPDN